MTELTDNDVLLGRGVFLCSIVSIYWTSSVVVMLNGCFKELLSLSQKISMYLFSHHPLLPLFRNLRDAGTCPNECQGNIRFRALVRQVLQRADLSKLDKRLKNQLAKEILERCVMFVVCDDGVCLVLVLDRLIGSHTTLFVFSLNLYSVKSRNGRFLRANFQEATECRSYVEVPDAVALDKV